MRLGVRRGDRVVLSLAGGEPLASLHFALQKLGAVSVPLSFRFGAAELAYCVADAAPVMLVTDESTEAVADEALADLPPLASWVLGEAVRAAGGDRGRLTQELGERLAPVADELVDTEGDAHASGDYRRRLFRVLASRELAKAYHRAHEEKA